MPYLPCRYLYISFIYCTCWVPTINVLKLAIFPCYSNVLLRRSRWSGILWGGVLGYVLPQLLFLWCYGVFCCSVSLRVILVFKDIIYVIITLYIRDIWLSVFTFGRMCGTIDPGSCIQWVLSFGIKNGYDRVGPASPTLGWLVSGFLPCHLPMSYYLRLPLVLDILKIFIDFGPYDAFPSSDVPEMVDKQYSWNSLVIGTYLLYLVWNVGMLVVNICILWPPTPPPHTYTHLEFCSSLNKRKELNPGDISKKSSAVITWE
jgi:hypothetical protein